MERLRLFTSCNLSIASALYPQWCKKDRFISNLSCAQDLVTINIQERKPRATIKRHPTAQMREWRLNWLTTDLVLRFPTFGVSPFTSVGKIEWDTLTDRRRGSDPTAQQER